MGQRAMSIETRHRVLVIDDEPLMGTTLKVTIGEENDVVVCTSGAEARALLESDDSFDVILCDLMMPGYSGMDLFASLTSERPDLAERMLFMTGGAYTSEARDFLQNTPNAQVQKPFDIDSLLGLIREVSERGRKSA